MTTNQIVSQIKELNAGTAVGCFMTDRLVVGVGLDYYWAKESRNATVMINMFLQHGVMETKSNAFLPNINLGYYYPVMNKLYANANLKLS